MDDSNNDSKDEPVAEVRMSCSNDVFMAMRIEKKMMMG